MVLTERQNLILNKTIEEYIDSAQPVSSHLLERRYDFGICPASIRLEMQKLTDKGFLYQPHTSAGRVPTDKGYRFFVNEILEGLSSDFSGDSEIEDKFNKLTASWLEEKIDDYLKFIQSLTKNLAAVSSALTLSYLFRQKLLWKEGWEELLNLPEFSRKECLLKFSEFLKIFEENIESLKINSGIKIYIGKENPFPRAGDFSIIISKCCLPSNEKGIIAFVGPKRMPYDKNINLINSLISQLKEF